MAKCDTDISVQIRKQADDWLIRLHSGQATHDDLEGFRRWYAQDEAHARVFDELREFWAALDPAARINSEELDIDAVLKQSAARIRNNRRAFIGAMVSVPIVAWLAVRPPLQLWPSVSEFAADYRTGTGEQKQLAMEDGVVVQMNTQTRINRQSLVADEAGIELLAGEAEIDIGTDTGQAVRPFTVVAGKGRLRANAARFNVRHSGTSVCVSCLDGIIEVQYGQQRIPLRADSQLTYDEWQIKAPTPANPGLVSAWRDGLLVFPDTPLAEVVREINRYRPGRLILRDEMLGRRRVQIRLHVSQLSHVDRMIGELYGVKVTELVGGIVFLG